MGTWQSIYLWEHRFESKNRSIHLHAIGEKKKLFIINNQYNLNMNPYLLKEEELKELSAKIEGWEILTNHIEKEFYIQRLHRSILFHDKSCFNL